MLTLEDKKDIGEIVKKIVDDAMEKSAMITKNSFDDINKRMATMEDLAALRKEMATKADLEDLATKADLEDLEHSLSTKYDHKIDRLQDDVRVIKTKLKIV
jgi:hypothetical protein